MITDTQEIKKTFRVMGINDDESYCSCCGKSGLKKVVWLAPVDGDGNTDGTAAPYGTTCAAYLLRITTDKATRTTRQLERAIEEKLLAEVSAHISALRAGWWTWQGKYLLPADMEANGRAAVEVLAERDARYPILGYLNGKLTLEQAAKFLK